MMDEKIIRSMNQNGRNLAVCTEKLEQTRQLLQGGRKEAGVILREIAMLACVGEYPMRSVYLLGNERVWKRKIRELQQWQDFCLTESGEQVRFQMLTVSGKGKNVTIRLHWSALPVLKRIGEAAYGHYYKKRKRLKQQTGLVCCAFYLGFRWIKWVWGIG